MIAPIHPRPRCPQFPKVPVQLKDHLEFNRKDRNHDNALSLREYLGRDRAPFGLGQDLLQKAMEFMRYDTNDDGKLSREEFLAGRRRDRMKVTPLPRPISIEGGIERLKALVVNRKPQVD